MMADDDQIRGALTRGEPSFTAHSTLQQLRPTMQRARLRRRVATGAATVALLAGGSAGVLAVATTQNTPTLRTVPGDESEQSAPGTASTTPRRTEAPALSSVPAPVIEPDPETSAVAPEVKDIAPEDPNSPAPVPMPAPDPAPATTAPPPPAALPTTAPPAPVLPTPAVSQTIASDCGDVLVSIENGTVRISSITTRPGYQAEVSDGGPISIEVVLRGAEGSCELHAELKSGGLDIDVQNSPADR
jgi:hypothetical protein